MATLVFVHGGWGGSWCWRDLARMMRAQGHKVYAPTLSGVAERGQIPPETVNLSSHIAEVAGLLAFEELTDVILIGHSYGGMVITGVADQAPDRVAGMIYFDAFLPTDGQSLHDLAPPATIAAHRAAAKAHDGGRSVPAPASPRTPAGPGVNSYAPYTPQPLGTMTEPWVGVRDNPVWPQRHYVLCTAYKGSPFHQIAAKLQGRGDWTTSELDAFHDVIYAEPDRAAAAIRDALAVMGK